MKREPFAFAFEPTSGRQSFCHRNPKFILGKLEQFKFYALAKKNLQLFDFGIGEITRVLFSDVHFVVLKELLVRQLWDD